MLVVIQPNKETSLKCIFTNQTKNERRYKGKTHLEFEHPFLFFLSFTLNLTSITFFFYLLNESLHKMHFHFNFTFFLAVFLLINRNYKHVKSHNKSIDRGLLELQSCPYSFTSFVLFCVSIRSSFETKWRIMWFRAVLVCVFCWFFTLINTKRYNLVWFYRDLFIFFITATIKEIRTRIFFSFFFFFEYKKKIHSTNSSRENGVDWKLLLWCIVFDQN